MTENDIKTADPYSEAYSEEVTAIDAVDESEINKLFSEGWKIYKLEHAPKGLIFIVLGKADN